MLLNEIFGPSDTGNNIQTMQLQKITTENKAKLTNFHFSNIGNFNSGIPILLTCEHEVIPFQTMKKRATNPFQDYYINGNHFKIIIER